MKIKELLGEAKDFSQLLYKIDKWMPNEQEVQDEYYNINTAQDMKDFFMNNGDEDAMRRYGFNGDWDALAKQALAER